MDEGFKKVSTKSLLKRRIIRDFVVNMGLPLLVYLALSHFINPNEAMTAVVIIPFIMIFYSVLVEKRINKYSLITLTFITLGIMLAYITGDERWLLARGSIRTGLLGIVLLLSSLVNRPLMVYLLKYIVKKQKNLATKLMDNRVIMRFSIANLIIGIVLVLDAILHIYLAFHLSVAAYLEILPVLKFGSIGLFVLILLWIRRSIKS